MSSINKSNNDMLKHMSTNITLTNEGKKSTNVNITKTSKNDINHINIEIAKPSPKVNSIYNESNNDLSILLSDDDSFISKKSNNNSSIIDTSSSSESIDDITTINNISKNNSLISQNKTNDQLDLESNAIVPYQKDSTSIIPNSLRTSISNYPVFRLNAEEICEQATVRIFKKGNIYSSAQDFAQICLCFSLEWGFRASREGCKIHCNKSGYKDRTYRRKRETTSIKCGCQWRINFRRLNFKEKDDKRIIITKVFPKHTNTCTPGKDQLVEG